MYVMKKIIYLMLVAIILSSCLCTKTYVGNYRDAPGTETHYSMAKQVYILGFIPLGHPSAATPRSGNCIVTTHRNFWDFVIPVITLGIVQTYTIDITVKTNGNKTQKPATK